MSALYPPHSERICTEILVDGAWQDISTRVRGEGAGGITLAVGRADEGSRVVSTRATALLDNSDGYLSDRNPLSPWYGLLGRGTQMRIALNEVPGEGSAQGGSTSIQAPDVHVTYAGAATLFCYFVASNDSAGSFNITVPGSMSAGAEVDGSFSTSRYATEAVVGPLDTGTRTATVTAGAERVAGLSAVLPGTPTITQKDSDTVPGLQTLTTDGTPAVGDWLMIATVIDYTLTDGGADGNGDEIPMPDDGEFWSLVADSGPPVANSSHGKIWIRPVTTAGVQTVQLSGSTGIGEGQSRLFLITNWEGGYGYREARRFWGFVPEWPSEWDVSGNDVRVNIQGAGLLRRLGQGEKTLKSAVYREAMNATNLPQMVAYWPLEDGVDAKSAASPLSGAAPMRVVGDVSFAADSSAFPGTDALPTFAAGSALMGYIPPHTHTGTISVRSLWAVPAAGLTDGASLVDLTGPVPPGTVRRWSLRYRTGGQLSLHGLSGAGVELFTSGAVTFDVRGQSQMIAFSLVQDGADTDWTIWTREIQEDGTVVEGGAGGTFAGCTLSAPDIMVIGNGGLIADCTVGHAMFGTSAGLAGTIDSAIIGHAGETAGERIVRLCAEEGVQLVTEGNMGTTTRVGPQRIDTLTTLLFDAAAADRGILQECRYEYALQYRARTTLYNQQDGTPLTLDYSAGHMTMPFRPTDDDQPIWNDVTVERTSGSVVGSYARSVQETGRLGTDTIGTYDRGRLGLNLFRDEQLADVAAWIKHQGTWDEARYPDIGVILSRTAFTGHLGRLLGAVGVDLGDVIVITDPPAGQPPGDIENMAQGYTETITNKLHTLRWVCTPAGPWRVAVADFMRVDTAGSVLYSGIDSSTTTLEVATTQGPLWTTDDTHFSATFQIVVGGEVMEVTDIAPPASLTMQAGTVAHGNNASVAPSLPASVQSGDLLVCFAAIRNSGTGTVAALTQDYEQWFAHGNIAVYAKIAGGSEGAPTVSFSGGVANADTSAQIVRFRGGKYNDVGVALRRYARCLNASAQDITYPGLVVPEKYNALIYGGWKQDDWTSVTGPGTEIGEPDTTTGDDQGIVWAWAEQGDTPASIASGAFSVTGGATAISRGFVLGFTDDRQTFTVVRSVNGVVKPHSAGAAVSLRYPMRPAL